jgi:hypothetical protein
VLGLGQKYYPIRWEYGSLFAIFGLLFAGVIVSVSMLQAGLDYLPRLAVKLGAIAAYALVGVGLGIASKENMMLARHALSSRLPLGSARTS